MDGNSLDRIIKRYMSGDSDSFDLIYFETQKSVYLSIRLIISNKTIIEDLMQDCYMKAIENINQYKMNGNFKAWISAIARNCALRYYNVNKRIEIHDNDDNIFEINDSSPKLKYYLSYLDGLEKDVIVYHFILNMKFREISEIIEKPISTVYALYKSALKKIKQGVEYED